MKRFLKVFALLIVSLFALVSSVDATLDHITHSATQSSYTVYDEKGTPILAYTGDLRFCKSYVKPGRVVGLEYIHRS
jgi:hypothetical protein